MEGIRKEISEFLKWGGVILYGSGMETPLNEDESRLLETYVTRISEKFDFSLKPADPNAAEQPKSLNGKDSSKGMPV